MKTTQSSGVASVEVMAIGDTFESAVVQGATSMVAEKLVNGKHCIVQSAHHLVGDIWQLEITEVNDNVYTAKPTSLVLGRDGLTKKWLQENRWLQEGRFPASEEIVIRVRRSIEVDCLRDADRLLEQAKDRSLPAAQRAKLALDALNEYKRFQNKPNQNWLQALKVLAFTATGTRVQHLYELIGVQNRIGDTNLAKASALVNLGVEMQESIPEAAERHFEQAWIHQPTTFIAIKLAACYADRAAYKSAYKMAMMIPSRYFGRTAVDPDTVKDYAKAYKELAPCIARFLREVGDGGMSEGYGDTTVAAAA